MNILYSCEAFGHYTPIQFYWIRLYFIDVKGILYRHQWSLKLNSNKMVGKCQFIMQRETEL